jgi:hypothetical protein
MNWLRKPVTAVVATAAFALLLVGCGDDGGDGGGGGPSAPRAVLLPKSVAAGRLQPPGISEDGSTVVGYITTGQSPEAFRWTEAVEASSDSGSCPDTERSCMHSTLARTAVSSWG